MMVAVNVAAIAINIVGVIEHLWSVLTGLNKGGVICLSILYYVEGEKTNEKNYT